MGGVDVNLDDFFDDLCRQETNDQLLDFCRKRILHGTPLVFENRDDDFYFFRKRIAEKFDIQFNEIFITGSAKLGFSPFKKKDFDLDSDIDVALISEGLFGAVMERIAEFQMEFRKNRAVVRESELVMYHDFLEYVALGWIRPDKLPISFQMNAFKQDWFEFFQSISNGKSEVGNYQVNAGIFKSYAQFERYNFSGIQAIWSRKDIRKK